MTNVVMPQMGESIAEGTIVRWMKKVGDSIDRDEPLFEISTDKVDAEIPSPAAGVLTEIKVHEGETVAVNSVVATMAERKMSARRVRSPPQLCPKRLPASRNPNRLRAPLRAAMNPKTKARRRAPRISGDEKLTAGAEDHAGAQGRSDPGAGHGVERPRHQAGHSWLHPAGKTKRSGRRSAVASRRFAVAGGRPVVASGSGPEAR